MLEGWDLTACRQEAGDQSAGGFGPSQAVRCESRCGVVGWSESRRSPHRAFARRTGRGSSSRLGAAILSADRIGRRGRRMMTPSRAERGSTANAIANFRAPTLSVRQTADRAVAERMERLWKNEGAKGRKRFGRFEPRNRLNKPNLFATGCHRLPPKSHGKEGVDGSSPSEGSVFLPA
jgi:hypothetical protein